LIHEKSPYLLQHAHNPVDWWPWGEEAFAEARAKDKPVFLSIGYSTCHWCHVMERESFENEELARLLNQWFVPVKVDREERPDVDRVYMNAALLVTGGGGWPLTVFLTPEGEPFYAGTYFPPQTWQGRPGLGQVLATVHEAWRERRAELLESARRLGATIHGLVQVTSSPEVGRAEESARQAYEHLARMFDPRFGGFGGAPKFPQPSYLAFLLRRWIETRDERPLEMTLTTLRHMAWGGIHDHLGGGFHRYSTDAEWRVPHFEKMLYDQAQLVCAYLEGYQASGDEALAAVARDVLDYVSRDLHDHLGGFYSAEDADSPAADGTPLEGAYYVWTAAELEALLTPEQARMFRTHYGIRDEGNVPHQDHPPGEGMPPYANVLHATGSTEDTARALGVDAGALARLLHAACARLAVARGRRPRPHRDDKVIASWNGLMVSAFARAAQILDDGTAETSARVASDAAIARVAADFVRGHLFDAGSGALYRRWRAGERAVPAELSDYACVAQGRLDLYETDFDVLHLERALSITEEMIRRFWDDADGGFFDTATGADPRLPRTKEAHDGAEPSGNSIAAANLFRIAAALERPDFEEKARRTVALFGAHVARSPLAMTQMWATAHWTRVAPLQVVIAGPPESRDTRALIRAARRTMRPAKVVLLADGGAGQEWLGRHAPYLRAMKPVDGRATAYLCENFTCGEPTTDPDVVSERLRARPAATA
jgi:uncharacterized protein YyaL (SSP411 family)